MRDATHIVGGAQDTRLSNKQAVRESWRAMLSLPGATKFLPLGLEPLTYVNGTDDGTGGVSDGAHPDGSWPDGTQALARLTAHAVLQAAGPLPKFDQCLWEPTGTWVEFWSSAGPITTTHRARSEAALGSTHPHWTEVMGFQINGLPAEAMQIVNGRVRIFSNGANFTYADAVHYGEGGATGMTAYPDDFFTETRNNLPTIGLGLAGLNGAPVQPLADLSVLLNTLPAPAPSFATSASSPYFLNPVNVPAGTSAITYAAKVNFAALRGNTAILFAQTSTGFDVELTSFGHLRLTIEDGTGAKMLNTHAVTLGLTAGKGYEIVVSADQIAQQARIMIGGALVANVPFTGSSNGLFQSNRALSFLARNNGSLQLEGSVEHLRAWHSATATGAAPSSVPAKEILGPAATANADTWKLGTNAT